MKAGLLRIAFATLLVLFAGCRGELSPEDKARVEGLKTDLAALRGEIQQTELRTASLTGGLLKTMVELRLETLKTTETLVQQRIHALEGGAKITIAVAATQPDPKRAETLAHEIAAQEAKLKVSQAEAAQYPGGLIGVMKQMTVATQEQSLAMLRSSYLSAKHGLAPIASPATAPASAAVQTAAAEAQAVDQHATAKNPIQEVQSTIFNIRLVRKEFAKRDYRDYIFFDLEYAAKGLDRPARAVKGVLHLKDLFGETKMSLGWTIDKPIQPGARILERGSGFEYNQFRSEHQWVQATTLDNMTATFTVKSILYTDGVRQDF